MIRRFEVRNFRMLRSNAISLPAFGVLVGKNATGKTTLLNALRFVSDVLRDGVEKAVAAALEDQGGGFEALCFDRGHPVEFAVDATVTDAAGERVAYRYELSVGPAEGQGIRVLREFLFRLPPREPASDCQRSLFGDTVSHVVHERSPATWRKIVAKTGEGKDYFRDERTEWNNVFRFGADRSALGSLPEDPKRFPGAIAVRNLLRDNVQTVELSAASLRAPSPPRSSARLQLDGGNLARAVRALKDRDAVLFDQWVRHVATAVDGLKGIDVWERPEDRNLVLRAWFAGAHVEPVPSWLLSDGTLRLLALTLLAYGSSEANPATYLIEEPENGLHPLAMQAVYDALSQPEEGTQILVATHSPVFLASVRMDQAIVFRRDEQGVAIIRRGDEVPELGLWRDHANLADLFATGVLA